MSSIGLIIVEKRELKELPQNWVPIPLGPRPLVQNLVEKSLSQNEHLALEMSIEGEEEVQIHGQFLYQVFVEWRKCW